MAHFGPLAAEYRGRRGSGFKLSRGWGDSRSVCVADPRRDILERADMNSSRILISGMLVAGLALPGCSSRASRSRILLEGPSTSTILAASNSNGPSLVSLGAGDRLGTRIHVFDVYLAAMERMGPPDPGFEMVGPPVFAYAPVALFAGEPLFEPLTLDVSIPLAIVE